MRAGPDACGIDARPLCGAEVTAQIRRSDFGMTYGLPAAVADDVRIVIPIEALRD